MLHVADSEKHIFLDTRREDPLRLLRKWKKPARLRTASLWQWLDKEGREIVAPEAL
jgi:hypothetical protein